jgi:hypothetical protein
MNWIHDHMGWAEWVFSGIGVLIFSSAVKFLWRNRPQYVLVEPKAESVTQNPTMHQSPTLNQSPIVTQSPSLTQSPHIHLHIGEDKSPVSVSNHLSPPARSKPVIEALKPRIAKVVLADSEIATRGHRIIEKDDEEEHDQAIIAAFRMKKSSSNAVRLVARLEFHANPPEGPAKIIPPVVHHVHYGMWLDEGCNHVWMTLTNTKELVLLLQEHPSGKLAAIQDNRPSEGRSDVPSLRELPSVVTVGVILADDDFGEICSFVYEIKSNPLRVSL